MKKSLYSVIASIALVSFASFSFAAETKTTTTATPAKTTTTVVPAKATPKTVVEKIYVCEKDNVEMKEPGKCPKCGMELKEKKAKKKHHSKKVETAPATTTK